MWKRKYYKMLHAISPVRLYLNGGLLQLFHFYGEEFPSLGVVSCAPSSFTTGLFQIWHLNLSSAFRLVPNEVVDMQAKDFDGAAPKGQGAWVIDYFTPWCGHCHAFAPKFIMTSLVSKCSVGVKAIQVTSFHTDERIWSFSKFLIGNRFLV